LTTPLVTSCMYAYSPGASTRSRFVLRSSMCAACAAAMPLQVLDDALSR
jgi:hypothetical protein